MKRSPAAAGLSAAWLGVGGGVRVRVRVKVRVDRQTDRQTIW